jgi:hypothetical protein
MSVFSDTSWDTVPLIRRRSTHSGTHIHATVVTLRFFFWYVLYVFIQYIYLLQHAHPCCTVTLRILLFAVRIYYLLCTVRIHRNPSCTILCAIPEFSTYRQQIYLIFMHVFYFNCKYLILLCTVRIMLRILMFAVHIYYLLCTVRIHRNPSCTILCAIPEFSTYRQQIYLIFMHVFYSNYKYLILFCTVRIHSTPNCTIYNCSIPKSCILYISATIILNVHARFHSTSYHSLASSFLAPTHYMSPSPLCVLLTQCCDDVH